MTCVAVVVVEVEDMAVVVVVVAVVEVEDMAVVVVEEVAVVEVEEMEGVGVTHIEEVQRASAQVVVLELPAEHTVHSVGTNLEGRLVVS